MHLVDLKDGDTVIRQLRTRARAGEFAVNELIDAEPSLRETDESEV